ncbi:hypothetical protein ACFSTC_33915 [Nonomuraea ferruginea]
MTAPRIFTCTLALAALTIGACSAAPTVTGGETSASGVAGGDGAAVAGDPSTSSAPRAHRADRRRLQRRARRPSATT